MITTQTLNALLVDRHLGELPPEVVSLLDTYLEQNPGALPDVADIEETLDLARAAMSASASAASPTPESTLAPPQWAEADISREDPAPSRTVRRPWPALAASVMVGAIAGYLLGATALIREPAMTAAPSPLLATAPLPSKQNLVKQPGFWSRTLQPHTGSDSSLVKEHRVVWNSPFKKPQILSHD